MTITISPFVAGIICTIGAEILAFILTAIFFSVKNSRNSRRNGANSSRSDNNE